MTQSEIFKDIIPPESVQKSPAKKVFYNLLRKIGSKATRIDRDDESTDSGDRIIATTGWRRVKNGNEEFELKFDTVNRMTNGDYENLDEVWRREIEEDSEGRFLFTETGLWPITMFPIRTAEELQGCIDVLELLDKAIPNTTPASS